MQEDVGELSEVFYQLYNDANCFYLLYGHTVRVVRAVPRMRLTVSVHCKVEDDDDAGTNPSDCDRDIPARFLAGPDL